MSKLEDEFQKSAQLPQRGSISEFVMFLVENKKWWLLPILITMLIFSAVFALGATGAAPFIYTLF
jgi:Family of unknown function (DUF5989)